MVKEVVEEVVEEEKENKAHLFLHFSLQQSEHKHVEIIQIRIPQSATKIPE